MITGKTIGNVVGGFGVLLLAGFGIPIYSTYPDSKPVIFEPFTATYATPECVQAGWVSSDFAAFSKLAFTSAENWRPLADARKAGKPDPVCGKADGFTSEKSNATYELGRFLLSLGRN